MNEITTSPTKSNLRKIKDELAFASEGFELLNHKREILIIEIMKNTNYIKIIEQKFNDLIAELFDNYRHAAVEMGTEMITLKADSEKVDYTIEKKSSRFIGTDIPEFIFLHSIREDVTGLFGSTITYDLLKLASSDLLRIITEYASALQRTIILARELKKVQRRVNALEKIYIPGHEKAKKHITERLNEMERDEWTIKKHVKEMNDE